MPQASERLEGRLVVLEPLVQADRIGLAKVAADPEIWRWMHLDGSTSEGFRSWFDAALAAAQAGTEIPFVTRLGRTGEAVGSTRFLSLAPEHRRVEIGHTWLARSAWGTGANVEAKLLMLRHAFGELGCLRVEFKTTPRTSAHERLSLRFLRDSRAFTASTCSSGTASVGTPPGTASSTTSGLRFE